ncbi:MAG: cation diffusion facilitator family transporter [Bacteroidetes bacterium RIFCSPLOWO2_12_FULL_35_15]|nr:MAG: cation diffusion facilitator family transporter [Bacteroidetes bacterium RIFCSPLOWO2_12_FULL_35_15]
MISESNLFKIKTMRMMLIFSILLMGIKFTAYVITHSNAILTDALESIINVVAGSFALFSIYYASQPKDENHPYGHGKIEYLSVGIEGGLIIIAGSGILIKSVLAFFHPAEISSLDIGVYISVFAGAANYFMGAYLLKQGKARNSSLMVADGKHLLSDTISSVGLVIGLLVIYFTKLNWLDNVIAILFGLYIFVTGYKLIKESVNSLLDEADYEKLNQVVEILNTNRREKWIDMHNLRVLKYGPHLHIDSHITLPWYDTLEDSHKEVTAVENLIKEKLEGDVEFFIHADPCLPSSCPICSVKNCPPRKAELVKQLDWTLENMLPDAKHTL